ncbi:hypothetical protein M8494_11095 [Serratia ureilytica]
MRAPTDAGSLTPQLSAAEIGSTRRRWRGCRSGSGAAIDAGPIRQRNAGASTLSIMAMSTAVPSSNSPVEAEREE